MVAAAAVPMIIAAGKGAQHTLGEALTADLAVIRWQGRSRRKPIMYELHVNPAALGLGALGVAAAVFILDEDKRRGVVGGAASTWWDTAKYGSPVGFVLGKLFGWSK